MKNIIVTRDYGTSTLVKRIEKLERELKRGKGELARWIIKDIIEYLECELKNINFELRESKKKGKKKCN